MHDEIRQRQQTCTTQNIKESSSGRRKFIIDKNLELNERMKNTESGKYRVSIKDIFLLNFFKRLLSF